jgi:hypothetical protein
VVENIHAHFDVNAGTLKFAENSIGKFRKLAETVVLEMAGGRGVVSFFREALKM